MTEPLPYRPFGAFRFALAATVMLGHGAWIAKGYWVADTIAASRAATAAVLTFFVLSGFFLSESADRTYRGRTGAFVKNRLLKIYPAFLGALCVSLVVHSALTGAGLFEQAFSFEGVASADIWNLRNLLWNPLSVLPFFRAEDVSGKLVPAPYLFVRYIWAINVEMMFYASVAAFLLLKSKIPRMSPVILAVTLLVLNIFSSADWDAYQYIRFSPFFALGVAIYGMSRWGFGSSHTVLFLVSSLLSAVNGYQFIGTLSGTVFLGASVILITILAKGHTVWSRVFDAELGDLSYAVYLNHYVVLLVFSAFEASGILAWLFAFLAVIVISFVLNRVLEKPLRKIRQRVREEPERRSR